jgi:ABC-2 type transport system permease protein
VTTAHAVRHALLPRWLAARNAARRSPWRPLAIASLVVAFWAGIFVLFVHVLDYFQTIGEFGPLLTQRLLVLLFLSFFTVLLISNTVTALTTFYLAGDVNLLLGAPLSFRALHHARFVETLVASSWMVLLFGLPAFLAYGVVYGAGLLFYLATVAVLATFVVIPAALGVLVTTALVMVFPAQRARDAMLVGTGLLLGAIVLSIRMLQPEQLAHPSGLVGLAGFLAGFGATGSPYLPTTWAAESLIPLLGAREGEPLFNLAMLASTAAMLFVVSATVVERLYLTAWSRAQTGRFGSSGKESGLTRALDVATRPLPRIPGLMLAKDVTVFLRDASQWSQLLLLCALVAIYLYNFSVLPLDDGSALGAAMRDLAVVLNMGLGAFVATAVAVRFVFPMPSLEGRAWWILRTAPLRLERIWWSKFWIGFVPLLAFAGVLIGTTNHYLAVPGVLTLVFFATLVPLIAAIVSLGLAFGAMHARLDTQNAAQIATGFGAIVYMVTSLVLIAAVVGLQAWPVGMLLRRMRAGLPVGSSEGTLVAAAFLTALGLMTATFVLARRRGLRALARLGA